nr:phage head closure protein [Clostridium paraputrificum]
MKFKISPGELKHPITIQHCVYKKNVDKIKVPVWEDKIKTRAKVLNVRGNEFIQAQGTGVKIEKTFYIRASKTIKIHEEDRIIFRNQAYEIAYINDIEERGIYIEIKARRCK